MKYLFILFIFLIETPVFSWAKVFEVDSSLIHDPIMANIAKNNSIQDPYQGTTHIYSSFHRTPYYKEVSCCTSIPFFCTYADGSQDMVIKDDVAIALYKLTKGNYVVAFVGVQSPNHLVSEDWLYTFSFNGLKIDSLCICREYDINGTYLSDYVSEISDELSIAITQIEGISQKIDKTGKIPLNWKARRQDFEYHISASGHFVLNNKSTQTYKVGIYDFNQLKYSSNYSIRYGKELLVNDNSTQPISLMF